MDWGNAVQAEPPGSMSRIRTDKVGGDMNDIAVQASHVCAAPPCNQRYLPESINQRTHAKMRHMAIGSRAVIISELRARVLTTKHSRHEWSAGMPVFPLADVVNLTADYDPAVLEAGMLRTFGVQRSFEASFFSSLAASRDRKSQGPSLRSGSLSPTFRASKL